MKKYLPLLFLVVVSAIVLVMSVRGKAGNPSVGELRQSIWTDNGPFELSPERGRYALLHSLVEDRSFQLQTDLARFATPDVGYLGGRYVSLFAPGVSFAALPGYWVGRQFGLAQVGAFLTISLFALLNGVLIYAIAVRVGAQRWAAAIAAAAFLFATPAFTYAVTLYQHHVTSFLMLLSIYSLVRWKGIWPLFLVWFLLAFAIVVDSPNAVFLSPIGIAALLRLVSWEKTKKHLVIHLHWLRSIALVSAAVPLMLFLWFNQESFGQPWKLAGTVTRATEIDLDGNPVLLTATPTPMLAPLATESATPSAVVVKDSTPTASLRKKTALGFFRTRNLSQGFTTHFVSDDRGILFYAPLVLIAWLGFASLARSSGWLANTLAGVALLNILLYSLWGDPWGGWAFGSRYLIPTYASVSIALAALLTSWQRSLWKLIGVWLILMYSVAVNTLGAITTSALPPNVERAGLALASGIPLQRFYGSNIRMLLENHSKSFVYSLFSDQGLTALTYYMVLVTILTIFITAAVILLYRRYE